MTGKNVWHLQAISSAWRPLAFLPVTLSASGSWGPIFFPHLPHCHNNQHCVILCMYFIPVSSYFPLPVPLLLSCHFLKMYLRNEHKWIHACFSYIFKEILSRCNSRIIHFACLYNYIIACLYNAWIYNSVFSSIFTVLCNHHCDLTLEYFLPPEKTP